MARKHRLPSKTTAQKRLGMTAAEGRAYLARWAQVDAHITAERRAMTPQQKFDELDRLMQRPKQLGGRDRPPNDDREVWDRWNKLREADRG